MLREERKRQVEAHQLEPMTEQYDHIKALVEGVVNNCGDKAHRRTHYCDCYGDNSSLKDNRICRFHIEHFGRDLKRQRTSYKHLERIGKGKLHQHDRPDRQHCPEHHNAALLVEGGQHAACVVEAAQHIAVKDIDVVEHKSVYCDDYGDKSEHHSLKLISRHKIPPKIKKAQAADAPITNTLYRNQTYAPCAACVVMYWIYYIKYLKSGQDYLMIKQVDVYRNYELSVELNMNIRQFFLGMEETESIPITA